MPDYPQSLEAALGQPLKFPPETLKAVRAFAASKPWRGTFDERQSKFRQLHADLCRVYSVNPTLVISGDGTGDSGGSYYSRGANVIVLAGRLSVITFLHEWGHAVKGGSEFGACRWSLRLFQRCFPKSFAMLRWEGHVGRAAGQGQQQTPPPTSKTETQPVPEEKFVMNNALMGKIVKVDGKRASVLEHVVDALASKFEDCPEVLGYLFWVRFPESSATVPVSPNENRNP